MSTCHFDLIGQFELNYQIAHSTSADGASQAVYVRLSHLVAMGGSPTTVQVSDK